MAIIDKPTDYFNTVLYSGNGASNRGITGVEFQPDLVWIKNRNSTNSHHLLDSVRGLLRLSSQDSAAEQDVSSAFKSFDSDGFTVTEEVNFEFNNSGKTYASWNWKAGTSFTNDASATGIGTLDSTGSSNQTAGFSIVSYTSNGSASQSVAHNLGGVPEMIISKNRDSTSASYNYWTVYHHSLATANDKKLKLNTTDAASSTNEWGDTDPTSTVYSLHTSGDGTTNHSTDKMISYCFRSIKGYSKISSFVGNGNASGTYVHLGFSPSFVLYKVSSAASDWYIQDNKRLTYNVNNTRLEANNSDAEVTGAADSIDMLSNGFKLRHTSSSFNASGATYIYMAFAENPFVTSTGVPATAR
jgi:hypothetical protein